MRKPKILDFTLALEEERTVVGKLQYVFRFLTRHRHQLDSNFRRTVLSHLATIRVVDSNAIACRIRDEIFHITDTWVDDWMAIITSGHPFYAGNDPHLQNCYAIFL